MTQSPEAPVAERQNQINWQAVEAAIGGLGIAADVHARADQLASIDGPGLFAVAQTLHTSLAPENSHEPTDYPMHVYGPDGTPTATMLQPDQRQGLYQTAAELIGKLAEQRTADTDDAFLARSANVVGLAIVMAHPFEDGNGRTSRTMSYLIREGFSGDQTAMKDLQLVGSNRPTKGFKINGTLPTKQGKQLSADQLLTVAASTDIPLDQTAAYIARKQDSFTSAWVD